MTAVAPLLFIFAEPSYISVGVLYVRRESLITSLTRLQEGGFGWVTPAKATVDEFDELLKTEAFRRSIASQTDLEQEMGGDPILVEEKLGEVQEAIWTQPIGDNLVLVGAAYKNPLVAQQLAQATLDNFIQWKINIDQEESVSAEQFFDSLVAVYESQREVAQDRLRLYLITNPEPIRGERPSLEQLEIDRLQAELRLAEQQLTNALERRENASLAKSQAESAARQSYLVIDSPKFPIRPATSRMSIAINALILIAAGGVISLIAVLGAALLDRSYRFAIDARHLLSLPVLAQIPDDTAVPTKDAPETEAK